MRFNYRIRTFKQWYFIMIVSFASFLCVLLYFLTISVPVVGPFSELSSADPSNNIYAIIFDGGSTGTRIHVFNFLNNTNNKTRTLSQREHLILSDEYFQEVRPGLSSYSENPHKAAESIVPLLERATQIVPSDKWHKTPVLLKATAGLRLLPSDSADKILNEVKLLFHNFPFQIREDSVSVMDGEDEGLFAWFTVNFLLDLLGDENSIATLDLGGGSTQVTFAPNDVKTLVFSPKEYIIKRTIQNESIILYTHSYLGLGLMSARLGILQSTTSHKKFEEGHEILNSPCIHPSIKEKWIYGGKSYLVKGMKSGKYNFDSCYKQAQTFLNMTVDHPVELPKRIIFALSYYFDRAADMGIIDRQKGGKLTINEYKKAASKACNKTNLKQAFLCLDSTYIIALLHHGLGLNMDTELVLVKKIDGVETSWGLGAGYSALTQG
ncbi:ectonucleoside triphosphate diphosphohydrolase 5-like isoform X1 [Centruroides vittatus]|uniref:ectonucleoside triphosphate diphosphohydrolase 5-like isoform X1 n=1 Tax=Centruroides vittatus TaxID=120091 RepID=UPI00350F55C6